MVKKNGRLFEPKRVERQIKLANQLWRLDPMPAEEVALYDFTPSPSRAGRQSDRRKRTLFELVSKVKKERL